MGYDYPGRSTLFLVSSSVVSLWRPFFKQSTLCRPLVPHLERTCRIL